MTETTKISHTLAISFTRKWGGQEYEYIHLDDNVGGLDIAKELEFAIEEIEWAYDDVVKYNYFVLRRTTTVSYTETLWQGDVDDFYNPVLQGT